MNLLDLLSKEITQDELLNYYNTTIIYDALPKYINGFIFKYDGINFMIINKNLSYCKKKETIIHELAHIELNHLSQYDESLFSLKIDKYEDEVDNYIVFLVDNIQYN